MRDRGLLRPEFRSLRASHAVQPGEPALQWHRLELRHGPRAHVRADSAVHRRHHLRRRARGQGDRRRDCAPFVGSRRIASPVASGQAAGCHRCDRAPSAHRRPRRRRPPGSDGSGRQRLARFLRLLRRSPPGAASSSCCGVWRPCAARSRWGPLRGGRCRPYSWR